MRVANTEIDIVRGSVTDQPVDVIVDAANTAMRGGGGIDGRIHQSAGPEMMEALRRAAPDGAVTAEPVMTPGFGLPQPWVIHVAGPVWQGGLRREAEALAACYANALAAADARGLSSIAFCSISTGVYRYPLAEAAPIALRAARNYAAGHQNTSLRRIVFALWGEDEYAAFLRAEKQAEREASGRDDDDDDDDDSGEPGA